jgi:hypothetical protein
VTRGPLKTVHLAVHGDVFKALYFDWERSELRPNLVFVDADGSVVYEINDVGLKGDPLDPSRKLAVVWGDSVVFGVGRSWPALIDDLAPGYQFLNGGIEGDGYANILRRAAQLNRQREVALNLLMLGWHPHSIFLFEQVARANGLVDRGGGWARLFGRERSTTAANRELRERLTAFLRAVPNTVVLTMPTALNPSMIDDDLSKFVVDGDESFTFLGRLPYSIERQRGAFAFICERNQIAREVCAALNIRVIDLFERFNTEGQPDFRTYFADILHFRPRAFPLVAQTVHEGIKDLLV